MCSDERKVFQAVFKCSLELGTSISLSYKFGIPHFTSFMFF